MTQGPSSLNNLDFVDNIGEGLDTGGPGDQGILKATFRDDMGANCHQRQQGQFPAAVLTDIFGNILLSSYESRNNKWIIRSARPTITRFWSASTLYITCVCNRTDVSSPAPPLPNVLHAQFIDSPGVSAEEEPPASLDEIEEGGLTGAVEDDITNVAEDLGFIEEGEADTPSDTPAGETDEENVEPEEGATPEPSDVPAGEFFTAPLNKGDEIMLYLGMLPELRPVLQSDLEDENRLLRVFIGIVDTISVSDTANGGTTLTIQARDRMRYLMDSLVTYNSSEDFVEIIGLDPEENEDDKATRSSVILQVARRSVGQITAKNGTTPVCSRPTCGMRIDEGTIYDIENMFSEGTFEGITPNIFYEGNYSYTARWTERVRLDGSMQRQNRSRTTETVDKEEVLSSTEQLTPEQVREKLNIDPAGDDGIGRNSVIEVSESSQQGIGGSVVNYPMPSYYPKFHIATGRIGFPDEKFGRNFSLVDRVPLEYIKYLASQEIYPTEVFCDHRTGDFYYTPRANDTNGLFDPQRFYRTYYNRIVPAGHYPDHAQMLVSFREESSMVNFRSNIIVSNVESGPGGSDSSEAIQVHLKVVPKWLENKRFACTFYNFTDPTITNTAEAAIIALQVARTVSKETRAAVAVILGDPSIVPGEVVQVIGSSLYPEDFDPEVLKKQVDEFVEYNRLYNQTYVDYQEIIHDTSEGNVEDITNLNVAGGDPVNISNQADKDNAALMCGDNASKLVFKEEPRSLWRVEAVIHHYNEGAAGFSTELALISPF